MYMWNLDCGLSEIWQLLQWQYFTTEMIEWCEMHSIRLVVQYSIPCGTIIFQLGPKNLPIVGVYLEVSTIAGIAWFHELIEMTREVNLNILVQEVGTIQVCCRLASVGWQQIEATHLAFGVYNTVSSHRNIETSNRQVSAIVGIILPLPYSSILLFWNRQYLPWNPEIWHRHR